MSKRAESESSSSQSGNLSSLPVSVNVRAVGSTLIAAASGVSSDVSQSNLQFNKTRPPVTVRVLGRPPPETETISAVNFNVKIFNPDNKKEQPQVFVLRDIAQSSTSTPEALMKDLCRQFGSFVPKKQPFHIGYMKGSLKVSIRTPADMKDVWLQVSKGQDVVLWCEGVGDNGGDSEEELPKKRHKRRKKMSALEEKNERIEDIIRTLSKKHDDHYTPIQYRLWAEMVEIGTHR